ncbi:unnamed protein product, partial [Callosobruchus maculatus]
TDTSSVNESTGNTSSPVNKRRGFSGRKWLPPPLRKLSQGKVDKGQTTSTTGAGPPPPPPPPTASNANTTAPATAKKATTAAADKRAKVPCEMGNKPSTSEGEEDTSGEGAHHAGRKTTDLANGGTLVAAEDADEEVELPPPMKPIQEPILVTSSTATPPSALPQPGLVTDGEDNNPCKREQHSELQLTTTTQQQTLSSLTRDSKSETAISDMGDSSGGVGVGVGIRYHPPTMTTPLNAASATFSGDESDRPSSEDGGGVDEKRRREVLLKKRQYVLKELIDTEEAYVRDLSMIVEGYIATMKDPDCKIPMPEDLKDGKDKLVFGNIEMIYDWHKNFFLKSLQQAIENPIELASLFKRYERKLQMYVIYCKNKHVSEYIVSEYLDTYFEELRVHLGHKLQLCDLLIKPVQRIMKYQLMLKDILKYTERAGLTTEIEPLRAAYKIMVVVPKTANDMMDVGRLQGFEGKITAQGKLLYHGILSVSDLPGSNPIVGKNKDLHVFFFEQSIIFSEVVGKKTQFTSPQYIYKAHIQVNKMSLEAKEDCFVLESTDPNIKIGFSCQAANEDVQRQWVTTIHDILQTQRDFLKAIQSPIAYQKELTREASLSNSMWDITSRHTSVPPLSSSPPVHSGGGRTPRKPHYVQKANTIGIPTQGELEAAAAASAKVAGLASPSPRYKPHFLEGLRNTLRHKHKSDSVVLEAAKEADQSDAQRRWSEANHSTCEIHVMPPGTQARLVCEWPDLSLGEIVTVIRYESTQGYLVRTNANQEELWVPAHVLSNHSRKPWSFRFRKTSRRSIDANANQEGTSTGPLPEFCDRLKDITVQSGTKVILKCRVKNCGQSTKYSWKKLEPSLCVLRNGRFVLGDNDEGVATLCIENVKCSDSGTYSFTLTNQCGSTTSTAVLTVTNSYPPQPEPKIQNITCSSVTLEWEPAIEDNQVLVEYCKLGSGEWISPNKNQPVKTHMFTVENLIPGETYSFRTISIQNNVASLPSVAVTLPVAENLRWQQEQFKRRYVELEEIDRGRFSVVRLARDRGTGMEVALKQVTRRKQSHEVTQAEYSLLAGMQHINIIRSLALFDNAPLPGIDTIVLELVKGPLLLKYICEQDEITEDDVRCYIRQLISSLNWLHSNNIAHLDLKPENVMVDLSNSTPILKLVDFGDSVNTTKNVILPPACLEFASPELVLGQPVGKHTDCWATGVFLYVLLSGVSPFLDDSMEETTANILKCDYCFPEEYFAEISDQAKDLIRKLLVIAPAQRLDMLKCLEHSWMTEHHSATVIPSSRLKTFMHRRHPMNVSTTPTTPTYYDDSVSHL